MEDQHSMTQARRSRRRVSLRGVLFARDAAFVLLVLVVIGGVTWAWFHQAAAQRDLGQRQAFLSQLQESRADLYRVVREVFDHRVAADPQARAHRNYYARRVQDGLDRLVAIAPLERRQAVEELRTLAVLMERRTNILMRDPPAAGAAGDDIYRLLPLRTFDEYEALFTGLESTTAGEIVAAERRRIVALQVGAAVLAAGLFLAVALLLLSRYVVNRALVAPVARIVAGAARFGEGELEHALPEEGVSEIVAVEQALNHMAANLKESRRALATSEKEAALGQLVPVVAHNIRNPLASIRAAAQVIDDPGLAPDLREGLSDVRKTVDRLEAWIDSLLSYLNPMRLKRRTIPVDDIVSGALDLISARIGGKGITVIRPEPSNIVVTADPILVEQALHGLLVNAVEVSREGDQIEVRLERGDGEARVVVLDEGPGMTVKPSSGTLRPGPTTKATGSGLGLPFAFKVCEMHGGTMTFEPRPRGTAAVFTLPLAADLKAAG